MQLNKTQKEIINGVIKGKGYYKTPKVPKNSNDKMLNHIWKTLISDVIISVLYKRCSCSRFL